jgi:probable rRNA maturation factor
LNSALFVKRARAIPVDKRLLRQIAKSLLTDLLALEKFDLGIYLVRAAEMTRVNENFLQHEGSTDVITFDYSGVSTLNSQPSTLLHGEIFICYDEAKIQARRFRTSWQSEIVRYIVHGVLHLQGFDDHRPADRRKMKREENRLLRELSRRFPISKLARKRSSS